MTDRRFIRLQHTNTSFNQTKKRPIWTIPKIHSGRLIIEEAPVYTESKTECLNQISEMKKT